MQTKQGFILSYIKYNDTGAIVKILEREQGIQSYFIRNIYMGNNKKKSYLNPLMGIEFNISKGRNNGLDQIQHITLSEISKYVDPNLVNHAQMALLAEFILKVVPYENADLELYDHMIHFCLGLDSRNALIYYIYQIIKSIGYGFSFTDGAFFDIKNGQFEIIETSNTLNQELSSLLKIIDNKEFISTDLSASKRRNLTDILMQYCQNHIPEFTIPKSLDIFREIF